MKNPGLLTAMSEAEREIDRDVEAARHWSEDQVAKTVRHFVLDAKSGRDAWGEKRILLSLGARTHSAVFAILSDTTLRQRLTVPTGVDLLPEAPINRICDILREKPTAEAIEPLAPFLADPSQGVRKDVILVIASVGTPEIVPFVRRACSDVDEYVRSYALMGLERAIQDGRLDASCRRDFFDDLQKLIADGKNAEHAAGLLLEFDQAKATDFFLSPVVFTPASASLHQVLDALTERKIPVVRERIYALIAQLEGGDLKFPHTYSLAAALKLLGQHRQSGDEAFLEVRVAHPDSTVAEGASTGLLAWYGLDGFAHRLSEKEVEQGFRSLSPPQQYYTAVVELDGEVNNGGHAQYFLNSSADRWREARQGLEAMGFKERIEIFRKALATFGGDGPSTDRDARQDQLAKLVRKDDAVFDPFDDQYYKCAEVVNVVATRYVIRNAAAFQ